MTLNHSTSITTIWLIWIFSMMICNNKEIGRRKIISLSYWIQHLCKLRTVQFSCSVVFSSLQPHQTQHARPPCPSPTSGVHPNPCPLSWWCHPTISSSVIPSPPAFNLPQYQGLFKSISSLHLVAKVLEFQFQHQSLQWKPRTDLL